MKKRFGKAVSLIIASALLLSTVSGIGFWKQGREAQAVNVVLENPRIEPDDNMMAKQKVTWDCVYFGSYPQAEVVSSAAAYSELDADLYDEQDIIEDAALYGELEKVTDWVNDETTLNGVKYCRASSAHANHRWTDYGMTAATMSAAGFGAYEWSDTATYHYFKYEPVKWRVLDTDDEKALLLSDIGLDGMHYDQTTYGSPVTWENCSVRSQLNGYGNRQNQSGPNFVGIGFLDRAFTGDEAEAIMETTVINKSGNTTDKVFLLSKEDMSIETDAGNGVVNIANKYGFQQSENEDEARMSYCSTYAKAKGVQIASDAEKWKGLKLCGQILRNNGTASGSTDYTLPNGCFKTEPNSYANTSRQYWCYAIRPSLYLDLSQTEQYEYAGTVCSDGTVTPEAFVSPSPSAAVSSTEPDASTEPTASASTEPDASTEPTASASTEPDASTEPTASASTEPTAGASTEPTASAKPTVSPSAEPSPTGSPLVLETPTPGETVIMEQTVYIKKRFQDEDTLGVYKITKTGENGTVIYLRPSDKTQSVVIIPDEVEYQGNIYRVVGVGENAFYKNKKLRQITLGANVTKISNRAFYKCTNLEAINFNKKLKRIGTKAFYKCNSLEKIVLPAKVEHIGVRAFYRCKNLRKAVLSKNLIELGTKSFYRCSKLRLDMSRVSNRHIAMGRKPFVGVKRVKYGNVKTRP